MIGVNTYGLTPVMQEDFHGALRHLADTGFDSIEALVIPKKTRKVLHNAVTTEETFPAFAKAVHDYGMTVSSAMIFNRLGPRFLPRTSVLRTLRFLRHTYGIQDFSFNAAFTDAKGARFWAEYLSDLEQELRGDDCHILFHNHDQELNKVCVDGEEMLAMDYFFRLVSPQVLLELDIGWAGNGADEVALAKQYADRIRILHLKDFAHGSKGKYHNPNVPHELFVPIGEGEIRTREVLDMRDNFPQFSGNIIIDQDFSVGDMLQDLRTGYQNVVQMMQKGGREYDIT